MATVNESTLASLDAPAAIETKYVMSVGDTFNGILGDKFDEDWVRIKLEKGKTYQITLSGRGKGGDEAEDTILKLLDAKGVHIATNDDINTAKGLLDSKLIFTAEVTGTYYISARSYTSNPNLDRSGAYTIMVEETAAVSTDVDTTIRGNNSSNRLTGTNDGGKILGLGGNDTLYGRGGDDELDGGPGDDILEGGGGADKLIGGSGNDTASYANSPAGVTVRLHAPTPRGSDAQGDTFGKTVTFTYKDKGKRVEAELPDIINLTGSDHGDTLAGDQRANTLSGGRGNDTLYGGPGGDDTNKDTIYGDSGDDRLFGGRGDDSLYGGRGNDMLKGGPDDDRLKGGDGDDTLDGGDGDDTLDGGRGDDILEGGDGDDIFKFSPGDGADDIKDFSISRRERDRIDLSDFKDIDSMDDLVIRQRGKNTRIDLDDDDGGEIWLLGIDKDDLDKDDFIFYRDSHNVDKEDDNSGDPVRPLSGEPDNDILYGRDSNDRLNGGVGNDVLYGVEGDDVLDGGPGFDSYEGGPGDDILIVDATDVFSMVQDIIDGGEDTSGTGHDNDTLSFEDWVDAANKKGVVVTHATATVGHGDKTSVRAYINIENIIGSRYADTLTGDDKDNVIEGGAGGDTLDGGAGSDTVSYKSSNQGVEVYLTSGNTYFGHAAGDKIKNFENIIGSRYADTLTGDSNANVIEGGAGRDILDGGGGNNTLSYQSSSSGVRVDLREGNEVDIDGTAKTIIRTSTGGHASGDKAVSGTFVNIIGSRYGDRLTGNSEANVLEGGPGADTLDGGGGTEDTASYANARAGVTVDLSSGTTGRGTKGDASGDRFTGIEKFQGSAHDDTFIASQRTDNVNGGEGSDTISYEKSKAKVTVNLSSSKQSDSTTNSYANNDAFTRIENVTGSNYDDTLTGDSNANVIDGGKGNDTLDGSGGKDTFRFARGDGNDQIRNFKTGEDRIDLTAFTDIASLANLTQDQEGENTRIDLPGGGQITLIGIATDLPATDFIFYFRPVSISDRNDVLTGNDKANTLIGGKGNDRLYGRGGDDTLYGGDGDDRLEGGAGSDTLHGGRGSDIFFITYQENEKDTVKGEGDDVDRDGVVRPQTPEQGDVDTITYEDWVDNANRTSVTLNLASNSSTNSTIVEAIENIIGSRYADTLTGDDKDNVIEGGAGGDTLDGGAGSDTVSYKSSNQGVEVYLTSGNTYFGHAAGDKIKNFENIIGSRYADTLTGDDKDNVIEGGAGRDILDGGGGNNTLSYQGSSSGVRVDLRAGNEVDIDGTTKTIIRTSTGGHASGDKAVSGTFVNIIGSRYGDRLTGNSEANVLEGGPGADTLDGGGGTEDTASYANARAGVTVDLSSGTTGRGTKGDASGDRFTGIEKFQGSAHDDTFIASQRTDNVNGGEGSDTISYEKSKAKVTVNLSSSKQSDSTTNSYANNDAFTRIENVTGSNYDDTLTGDSNANVIDGGKGNDTLDGSGGKDTFRFARGDGNDQIRNFKTGEDRIDLTAFTDIASLANLTQDQEGENTRIDLPGGGQITLIGIATDLPATDFIFYFTTIDGTSGNNELRGDRRDNEINAGAGNDRVFGNGGNDILNGEAGDDTLYGGADKDKLNGGAGDDVLDGGPGADTFVFAPGHGNDYITDFNTEGNAENADKIDLTALDITDNFATFDDNISQSGDNTVIDLSKYDGGTITLLGIDASDLAGGDFTFVS